MSTPSFSHSLSRAQGDLGERTITVRTSELLSPAQWEEIRDALGTPHYSVTEVGEIMPLVLTGDFAEMLEQARKLRKGWQEQVAASPSR